MIPFVPCSETSSSAQQCVGVDLPAGWRAIQMPGFLDSRIHSCTPTLPPQPLIPPTSSSGTTHPSYPGRIVLVHPNSPESAPPGALGPPNPNSPELARSIAPGSTQPSYPGTNPPQLPKTLVPVTLELPTPKPVRLDPPPHGRKRLQPISLALATFS